MSIIHALLRWILGVFAPGTGRRRAGAHPAVPAARAALRVDVRGVQRLPAARSPYGLPEILDGAATVPVRPYVLAADFGIGLDRYVVGAVRAA